MNHDRDQPPTDGMNIVYNNTGSPEPVVQWRELNALQVVRDRDIETEPVGTDDHHPADGEPGRYGGPTANPNPNRIPDTLWWLWLQLHDLEPATTLGGIYAFKKGYHSSRLDNQRNWSGNYSVREPEDQGGPNDKAAALDWTFPSAQRGDHTMIAKYTRRLMASALDKNDPRLDGLREFYGQADSDTAVEGYDCRHLKPVTSDASHLWHLHFSFDRNTVTDPAVAAALLSVLRGESLAAWKARRGGATPAVNPTPTPTGNAPGARTLRLTDPRTDGPDVLYVQRWIGPARAGVADGIYGPKTEAGVRWYQGMRGIPADGVVGPQTWRQMGVAV